MFMSMEDELTERALLQVPEKGPLKFLQYVFPWNKLEDDKDMDWAVEHADEIYESAMKEKNLK